MTRPDYDLTVLGGGLAGGLLARQMRLQRPDLRILVLERSQETSYKVGEATVELFSNYLVRKLGLSTYLYEHHLPKNGLRFFFDDHGTSAPITEMSELGSYGLPFHPSFQLDRSALERELRDGSAARGAEVVEGAKVTDVDLGEPHHCVTFEHGGATRRVTTTWVVDATGRAARASSRSTLRVPERQHRCLASWARLGGVADLDGRRERDDEDVDVRAALRAHDGPLDVDDRESRRGRRIAEVRLGVREAAAVAEAEAEDDGGSLDAAAVASSRRGSGRQHHQCRGRRCRRRQKKKHESGA